MFIAMIFTAVASRLPWSELWQIKEKKPKAFLVLSRPEQERLLNAVVNLF
jgi:hypothetical protein